MTAAHRAAEAHLFPVDGELHSRPITDREARRGAIDRPVPLPLGPLHYGLALLAFLSFSTFRRREIWQLFDGSGFDEEIWLKLSIWVLLGLVAVVRWQSVLRNSYLLFRAPLVFFGAYLVIAFISTTYSLEPTLTLFRAGQYATALALGLSLADRIEQWPRLSYLFLGLNWGILIIGLGGVPESLSWRVLPSYQEAGFDAFQQPWRFGTPFGHFSQISIVAAMAGIAVAARLREHITLPLAVLLGWLTLTIVLTVSRTAAMGFLFGVLVVLAARGALLATVMGGSTVMAVLFAAPGAMDSLAAFVSRGQDAEQLESLTNRTEIYESALRNLQQHWALGYGFRADRVLVLTQQVDGSGVGHAHNALLEATLGLGVGGGIIAALVLLAILFCGFNLLARERAAGVPRRQRRSAEFLGMFSPVIAFSLLDSSFSYDLYPFSICFVAYLIDFTQHRATLGGGRAPLPFHPARPSGTASVNRRSSEL
jgi:O-antigen ligase